MQINSTDIIVDKFNELVGRHADYKAGKFNEAEEAIWLIVTLRCATDIDGFTSVFQQTFSKTEVDKTIDHLYKLGFDEQASIIRTALTLLIDNNVFNKETSEFSWDNYSNEIDEQMNELEIKLATHLWDADEKLAKLLNGKL